MDGFSLKKNLKKEFGRESRDGRDRVSAGLNHSISTNMAGYFPNVPLNILPLEFDTIQEPLNFNSDVFVLVVGAVVAGVKRTRSCPGLRNESKRAHLYIFCVYCTEVSQ